MLSRRSFVGAALLTTWGLAFGLAPRTAAAASYQVWGLKPGTGEGMGCSCNGCSACVAHAANKLFATSAAADTIRAHPGCKCLVVPLAQVDQQLYMRLFTASQSRLSVDRRDWWVQAALEQPALTAIGALRTARIDASAHGTRVLIAQIAVGEPTDATITLVRAAERLPSRTVRINGVGTVRLSIPGKVTAGPALLEIRLRDRRGRMKSTERPVRVPPVQAKPRSSS